MKRLLIASAFVLALPVFCQRPGATTQPFQTQARACEATVSGNSCDAARRSKPKSPDKATAPNPGGLSTASELALAITLMMLILRR